MAQCDQSVSFVSVDDLNENIKLDFQEIREYSLESERKSFRQPLLLSLRVLLESLTFLAKCSSSL